MSPLKVLFPRRLATIILDRILYHKLCFDTLRGMNTFEVMEWYDISNINEIDTPALLVFPDRMKHNIDQAVAMAGDAKRLRPHIKTHKSKEAAQMMLDAGIGTFKCATIAEAELLGMLDAPDVLLAYQPVGPKLDRLILLIEEYAQTRYSCLVDNLPSATALAQAAIDHQIILDVFIDLDLGMHRTGIDPKATPPLIDFIMTCRSLRLRGLHAYDGHIRDIDIDNRKQKADQAFEGVEALNQYFLEKYNLAFEVVCGGSPTFPIHAHRSGVQCSPGTFIYWDQGYSDIYQGHTFLPAAVLVTRIISKPTPTQITTDLGHKSVAAENELTNRVHFLNAGSLKPIGQSEEHLVLEIQDNKKYSIGDVLYAIPQHICPTVALYDHVKVVENNKVVNAWRNIARDRSINY